jgi:anti-sigma B factor antagonist
MSDEGVFSARVNLVGDVLELTITGDLDIATERELLETLAGNLASAPARVVIDLAGISFIDSSGLRGLLRCRDELAGRAVPLSIAVGDNPRVTRLLDIAGVQSWFGYE